ncbi:MAG: hypothetical protein R3192_17830 [Woeseiaceae bacterium]|nr:hypothetical protein [Woeseiaceae bacterium]
MLPNVKMLDDKIPLKDASYRDVVAVEIDIPMRYAELVAVLRDGRSVRLRRRSQLLGWEGSSHKRHFYFKGRNGEIVRIRTNAARRQPIRSMDIWHDVTLCRALSASDPRVRGLGTKVHRIIEVDGSLCFAAPRFAPIRSAYLPTTLAGQA